MRLKVGTELRARALLFDMDGTLVDSKAAIERVWKRAAARWNADFEALRRHMHGRRATDIMRDVLPPHALAQLDEEVAVVDEAEVTDTKGVVPIPGAAALLKALPPTSWALVTSARPALARARMGAAGLPLPDTLITSEAVSHGKPHPECFRLGAERLGVAPEETLALEDAPAGLTAARAAGCQVIALATTLNSQDLAAVDWIPDLSVLQFEGRDAQGWMYFRIAG